MRAHIFAIVEPKGGAGKSTTCLDLTRGLQLLGFKVLLIDGDPQKTIMKWYKETEIDINVIEAKEGTIHKIVPNYINQYDYIIIDTAAKIDNVTSSALKIAETVIIPIQPSQWDIDSMEDIIDEITSKIDRGENLKRAAFVVTQILSRTLMGKEIREVLKNYRNIDTLKSSTTIRNPWRIAQAANSTVVDMFPNSEAAKEANNIRDELIKYVNKKEALHG